MRILLVLLLFKFVSAGDVKVSEDLCPPDISPCTCVNLAYPDIGISITCNGQDFQDGQELKSRLSKPFPNDTVVSLYLNDVSFTIPSGLLGPKRSGHIKISCPDNSVSPGSIDPEAFSQVIMEPLTGLTIKNCDLSQTSFEFLASFVRIPLLEISSCYLPAFTSFPTVDTLTRISVTDTQLQEWYEYSNTPNLDHVTIDGVGKTNALNLLNSVLAYGKLEHLSLRSNGLEFIPGQVRSFPQLHVLYLTGNPLKVLRKGDLNTGSNLWWVDLANTELATFEAGAFEGNFSTIDLRNNPFTTFEEDVFKPLLTAWYEERGYGAIFVDGKFSCGCDIAWLVRSDNSFFFRYILYATCADGRYIEMMDPADFEECPI